MMSSQRIGEIYDSDFRAKTRGLTVFETGGTTKKWPFDVIESFQKLIGVDLNYIFISDRDFLTDEQIAARNRDAPDSGRRIKHLSRRNRESYLLEPAIISRVLQQKWNSRHPGRSIPSELREAQIRKFILDTAEAASANTRSRFLTDQDQYLRLPASDRVNAMEKLNRFFDVEDVNEVNSGRIPYKLLDAKQILRDLRTHITQVSRMSFSDKEITQAFKAGEIPSEIVAILRAILNMFASPMTRHRRRAAA